MNPQDVSALTMLLSILKEMITWPFGLVVFTLVVGPWIMSFVFCLMYNRLYDNLEHIRQKELAEIEISRKSELHNTLKQYRDDVSDIKRLYESNARLVVTTNALAIRMENLYSQVVDIISLNTQTQTQLVESIKENQYCPMVRKKGES